MSLNKGSIGYTLFPDEQKEKERSSEQGCDDSHWDFCGWAQSAGAGVTEGEKEPADDESHRNQSLVVWADQQTTDVGHHDAHEPDGSTSRDDSGEHEGDGEEKDETSSFDGNTARGGEVVV